MYADFIATKSELCVGCNKCIFACPTQANTAVLKDEKNIIQSNSKFCIGCGECLKVCNHDARIYFDDTEQFFADLKKGLKISVIAAPSFKQIIPNYEKMYGFLKAMGVNLLYDVSFGADITVWAYIRAIQNDGLQSVIAQPCPVVVDYVEHHMPQLLPYFAPVHSPALCTAIYMKKYEKIADKIAFLSPCIAKSVEFNDKNTHGLIKYNVTYTKLLAYIDTHHIQLDSYEPKPYDNKKSCLGTIFPKSGGLGENIRFYLGKSWIKQVDGIKNIRTYLTDYEACLAKGRPVPLVVDAFNCKHGCYLGTAIHTSVSVNDVEHRTNQLALDVKKKEAKNLFAYFDSALQRSDFTRTYTDKMHDSLKASDEDIMHVYLSINKTTEQSRNINCFSCGYGSCRDFANAVALHQNHRENCLEYAKYKLKSERKKYEALVTAIPCGICINKFDADFSFIYANQGLYELVGFTEQEYDEAFRHSGLVSVYADDREKVTQAVKQQLTEKGVLNMKVRLIHKTKGSIWVHFSGRFLKTEDGEDIIYIVIVDISEQMDTMEKLEKLSVAMQEEQQFRASVLSDSIATLEYNVTKNQVITLFEKDSQIILERDYIYTELLENIAKTYVHPDDYVLFVGKLSQKTLLAVFNEGKRELITDFRKLLPFNKFEWLRAVSSLYQDIVTKDIRGLTYVKNIHSEKTAQLELKEKAERDPLTGLYNKITTEMLIKHEIDNLQPNEQHALLIIDIDNFKSINDKLGHLAGDIVLTSLANKLAALFRTNDIVGRVGGDEFFVFLKRIHSFDIVISKAKEINAVFKNTYSEKNQTCTISASIGIVACPDFGRDFQSLYKNADTALYITKEKGKNSFTIFEGQASVSYKSSRMQTAIYDCLPQKSFKDNRVEYLFKLLYASNDTHVAASSALELMTDYFNFSRGYLFVINAEKKTISNTIEWCANGVTPQIDYLQNIPLTAADHAIKNFYDSGMFIVKNMYDLPESESYMLKPRGIKSLFQFGVFEKEKLIGFIGFDDCEHERNLSLAQIDELATVCNVVALFIAKQHSVESLEKNLHTVSVVVDTLNTYTYVIDKNTFEILFMNQKTKESAVKNSGVCYTFLRGKKNQCADCPLRALENDVQQTTQVLHNKKNNRWMETSATAIDWIDRKNACLINSIDVTHYKNK